MQVLAPLPSLGSFARLRSYARLGVFHPYQLFIVPVVPIVSTQLQEQCHKNSSDHHS